MGTPVGTLKDCFRPLVRSQPLPDLNPEPLQISLRLPASHSGSALDTGSGSIRTYPKVSAAIRTKTNIFFPPPLGP
jgi:hypothetical protein